MALIIPGLLPAAQLDELTTALGRDTAPWVDGRVTAGHQGVHVKRNQQLDAASPLARELGDRVLRQLERHALFISAVLPHRVFPPMFNRYAEGMQFGSHVDGAVRDVGGGQRLRTDLSATLFLSAPATYEGGELVIERDAGEERHKLGAGDLLVYHATARHRVAAVTAGQRTACVFWVQSLVRDHEQRELLFGLDQAVQRLTALNADAESLVRLSAHYHALLRLWSEV